MTWLTLRTRERTGRKRIAVLALAGALLSAPGTARATLPVEGEPIMTNDYGIDLYQGPVLSANRVIGLAGAFVAIADGVEGSAINPAATAARTPYSYRHFDYDLGVGITFPSALENTDFWNSGRRTRLPKSESLGFLFLSLALDLQFGRWGFGLSSDFQQYGLLRAQDPEQEVQRDRLAAQIAIGHLQLAHAFADGQFLLGIGMRTTGLSVTNESPTDVRDQDLFSTVGTGFETGFIWRPNGWQIRIGGAFHDGFTTRASADSRTFVLYEDDPINRLYLPARVSVPWDVNVGFAAQLGPRPLNPRWLDPSIALEPMRRYLEWRAHERDRRLRQSERAASIYETQRERQKRLRKLRAELRAEEDLDDRERARVEQDLHRRLRRRYREQARFFVLVTTSLKVSGAVDNAVGIESMLDRTVQRSGEHFSISPHLGLETELIPHWLKLRGGAYLEPTRFASNTKGARLHATLGFDQKVLGWDVFGAYPEETEWRISGSLDASRNYLGWGATIGVWR
jgi:hypothetical protein